MSRRLSATEQKVIQLSEKLAEQNKSAVDTAEILWDMLVGIENLGEIMKSMKLEIICLRDPEYQEAEEELNRLCDPVSLRIPSAKGQKL